MMTRSNVRVTALLGTALTLILAHAASAATEIRLSDSQVPNLNEECRTLVEHIRDRNNMVPDERSQDVLRALNNDNAEACTDLATVLQDMPAENRDQADATARDSESVTNRESEEVSERVELEQEATIEGVAAVNVPEPNVDVEVDPPQVTVRKSQPEVSVEEAPSTIQVQQPQPNVEVEIPEIVVRVEVPAPSIFIQSDDPTVRVSSADPQVEVQQGEPRVTVTQPDPELQVDLGVDAEGDADQTDTETRQTAENEDGSDVNRGGDVQIASNEPQVEIVQPEGQPGLSINRAQPQVQFEGSEPNVSVRFTQQPTVELAQTGEVQVTFETAEERQARLERQQNEQPQNERQTAGNAPEQGENANDQRMANVLLVRDLLGMEVIGANGEELGEPEAVIERDGQIMLVIDEGGFLGLGEDQTAVPLSRVQMDAQNERLQLQELTAAEIDDARDFEYDASEEVDSDREIRLN
ncbi:hypothetical protein OB2597_10179 [Pseudooceanicola batsensis HTCC2597]|uniref:PRC-barrel domain-containing protein n=1 Tax=Pseudooceanicola batsensis (strain ATCC BAA-863 / DSM 15984 / KCTC 12145 / HTCC2597) TaxID=252305 RepID=A3TVF8_PSEBH|nr:PRC-barrel domain-containing protein [Pseudooceanicola batsensis]EAQ04504.1 hypothetical protein OB2597_10179 [Pseudooceanicola batsensis HTCC2597]